MLDGRGCVARRLLEDCQRPRRPDSTMLSEYDVFLSHKPDDKAEGRPTTLPGQVAPCARRIVAIGASSMRSAAAPARRFSSVRMARGLGTLRRFTSCWTRPLELEKTFASFPLTKKNTTSLITLERHNGAPRGYSVIVEEGARRPPSTSLLEMTLKLCFNSNDFLPAIHNVSFLHHGKERHWVFFQPPL